MPLRSSREVSANLPATRYGNFFFIRCPSDFSRSQDCNISGLIVNTHIRFSLPAYWISRSLQQVAGCSHDLSMKVDTIKSTREVSVFYRHCRIRGRLKAGSPVFIFPEIVFGWNKQVETPALLSSPSYSNLLLQIFLFVQMLEQMPPVLSALDSQLDAALAWSAIIMKLRRLDELSTIFFGPSIIEG